MKQIFTIVIFGENKIGLMNRTTSLFTQRHINIESMTVSESEYLGIHRFTVVIKETEPTVQKVVKQIEKQVDVLKAFCFTDEGTVFSEIALYKIKTKNPSEKEQLLQIAKTKQGNVKCEIGPLIIIEKTGTKEETQDLFDALLPFDIQGFVRSGRVSLSKTTNTFTRYLKEMESYSKEIITNKK